MIFFFVFFIILKIKKFFDRFNDVKKDVSDLLNKDLDKMDIGKSKFSSMSKEYNDTIKELDSLMEGIESKISTNLEEAINDFNKVSLNEIDANSKLIRDFSDNILNFYKDVSLKRKERILEKFPQGDQLFDKIDNYHREELRISLESLKEQSVSVNSFLNEKLTSLVEFISTSHNKVVNEYFDSLSKLNMELDSFLISEIINDIDLINQS